MLNKEMRNIRGGSVTQFGYHAAPRDEEHQKAYASETYCLRNLCSFINVLKLVREQKNIHFRTYPLQNAAPTS